MWKQLKLFQEPKKPSKPKTVKVTVRDKNNLSYQDLELITKLRKAGLVWEDVRVWFKDTYPTHNKLMYYMRKQFNTLPPCGEFDIKESLWFLKDYISIPTLPSKYKALMLEKNMTNQVNDKLIQCRKWYGENFTPSIHPSIRPYKGDYYGS